MLTVTDEAYLHPQQLDTMTVYTLDELRKIVAPLARKRGMRWTGVFGSYARGEANGMSDIDVLVDKGHGRFMDVGALAEDLYEATGKLPDIYDLSELRPGAFRDTALREAVTL